MERDSSHIDFIERWVKYMRENPKTWRKKQNDFINSQYESHRNFVRKILLMPNGKEKLRNLYNIKNKKGYPSFF